MCLIILFVLLKSLYKMRKVLFGFICLLALSFSVSAQQGGGQRQQRTPEESAKQYTETLKTELKLTAAQVASVEAANLAFFKESAKMRESLAGGGGGGDMTAMREASQKLQTQRTEAFKKVLTNEQMQAYQKYLEANPQRGFGGQGGQGQGGQGGQRRNQ